MSEGPRIAAGWCRTAFRWLGVSGATWLALVATAQFLPLTSVPGYEFSLLVGALCVVLGLPRLLYRRTVAMVGDSGPAHLRAAWWTACADLSLLVVLSALISLLNTFRVTSCATGLGLAYLAIFGLLNIPLVVATALVAEHFSASRWRYALACAAVGAAVAYSLWWLATQPSIVVYNPYAGYIAASIYDQSLVPLSQHLVFRGLCLAAAGAGFTCVYWRRFASVAARRSFFAAVAVLMLAWCFRAELHLERSRSWISSELGGVVESEHFTIHFSSASLNDAELSELVADHEAAYERVREFFGLGGEVRYRTFIYPDSETRGAYMGGRRTMIAKIWLGETHVTWSGPGDETLVHELAHLMLADAGRGPLRLSARGGVFPLMGLVEGSATAAAWGAEELTYHGWSAAIMELGLVEEPAALLAARGFWSQNSQLVYTLWGSFVRWLVEARGPDAFLDVYGDGNFERAYGASLADLLEHWQRFLSDVELSERDRQEAAFRFDRPSIFAEPCARRLSTLMDEGWSALRSRDGEVAERCFERLLATGVASPERRFQVARGFEMLGEAARAREIFRRLEGDERSGAALQQRARLALADLAWRQGRHEDALAWLRVQSEGEESAALRRHRVVRQRLIGERDLRPQSELVGRRYLAESWRWNTSALLNDLVALAYREQSAPAAYLAGLRLSASSTSSQASALLEQTLEAFADEEVRRNAELAVVRHAVLRGAENGCSLASGLSERSSAQSATPAQAEYWLQRCERSAGLYLDAAESAVE